MREWLRGLLPRRKALEHESPWQRRLRSFQLSWLRIMIGVVAVAAITWLFPREGTTEYSSWREGMVAPHDVIAPFLFNVRKNEVELEYDRARERSRVDPVVQRVPEVADDNIARLARFLTIVAESTEVTPDTLSLPLDLIHQQTIQWLRKGPKDNISLARAYAPTILQSAYDDGVLPSRDIGQLQTYFRRRAVRFGDEALPERVDLIDEDGTGQLVPFSRLRSIEKVRDDLHQMISSRAFANEQQISSPALRSLYNLIDSALEPDLYYDRRATILRETEAAARVGLKKRVIFKNERFIESHAVLTAEDMDELHSLMAERQERQRQRYQWQTTIQWLGRAAIVTAIVLMVGLYFRHFQPDIWRKPGWLLLCTLLAWLPLSVASFAASSTAVPVYMIPLSLTAMLATVLFTPQIGIALAAGTVLLGGAILGFDYQFVLVNSVAAGVATFTVRHVRNRSQFLQAMLTLPLGIVAAIVAVDATQVSSVEAMLRHAWPGAVNGLVVPILSMGLLVVCEKSFGITTNLTLLELSDLNSPILRQMAIRAPGTYTHSIIIANLAESAAEAIGANPLLARVGAYYHDLGKMQRPHHFVENQTSIRNPHDKLTPQMSVFVVMAHIKDGIEAARRIGLPKQLIDFIPQHHGTLRMDYFYGKAQKLYGPENVDEQPFRYPGPKPQTREAAILMMADAVEAAVRSLRERTPSRVQGMVEHLIKSRLDDGQFDECDLTLRDLERIEASFLPMLAGALHERIEYPKLEPISVGRTTRRNSSTQQ